MTRKQILKLAAEMLKSNPDANVLDVIDRAVKMHPELGRNEASDLGELIFETISESKYCTMVDAQGK
jgi:hypothetical protein